MNDNYILIENISYGNHERQNVDLFIPETVKCRNGIILYIHGGGWQSGDKSGHHPDCVHFCKLGYICASMNYRFVAENINVFDELDDISSALTSVKEICVQSGFEINNVILSGGSAGGHLSLLYAFARKNVSLIRPVAVCAYCPPVDCSKTDFLLGISGEFEDWKYDILSKCCGVKITKDSFLGEKQQAALKKMSPVEYLSINCVPVSIFHGKNDELVPFNHTIDFLEKMNGFNVENDLIVYENSGHALDNDIECFEKTRELILQFAEKYL